MLWDTDHYLENYSHIPLPDQKQMYEELSKECDADEAGLHADIITVLDGTPGTKRVLAVAKKETGTNIARYLNLLDAGNTASVFELEYDDFFPEESILALYQSLMEVPAEAFELILIPYGMIEEYDDMFMQQLDRILAGGGSLLLYRLRPGYASEIMSKPYYMDEYAATLCISVLHTIRGTDFSDSSQTEQLLKDVIKIEKELVQGKDAHKTRLVCDYVNECKTALLSLHVSDCKEDYLINDIMLAADGLEEELKREGYDGNGQ